MEGIKDHQKVLVVVKGGVVQSLYVSHNQIKVDVINFDNENFENSSVENEELEKLSKGLVPIL